jgi:hypothetical protein
VSASTAASLIGLVVAVSLMSGVGCGGRSERTASNEYASVANAGRQVPLTTGLEWEAGEQESRGEPQAFRLAVRGALSLYRVRRGDVDCYALGELRPPLADRISMISCPPAFPSRETPLVPFSLVESTPGRSDYRVFGVDGVAADAVARVGLTDSRGHLVAVTHVKANVFTLRTSPHFQAVGLVAFDSDGDVVAREAMVPAGKAG